MGREAMMGVGGVVRVAAPMHISHGSVEGREEREVGEEGGWEIW